VAQAVLLLEGRLARRPSSAVRGKLK
jgi:hypothetical protein